MIKNKDFEIVTIADEYMAVPIGEEAVSFHGVIALSEAAAFLLNNLNEPRTKEDLVGLLCNEYDVDRSTAENDVEEIISKFRDLKVILD